MRILLFSFLTLFAAGLLAQNERGTWFLDANTQFTDQFNDEGIGLFSGSAGYFVRDGLLVGARSTVSYSRARFTAESVLLGPFVRYYLPFNWGVRVYGEAGIDVDLRGEENNTLSVFGGIGLERELAPQLLANARLEYSPGNPFGFSTWRLQAGLTGRLGGPVGETATGNYGQQGSLLFNGFLNLEHWKRSSPIRFTLAEINAAANFFVSDQLMLNGNFYAGTSHINFGTLDSNPREFLLNSTRVGVNLGLSYLFDHTGRFRYYAGAEIDYNLLNSKQESSNALGPISTQNDMATEVRAVVKGGILYQLTNSLVVDAKLGLTHPFGAGQNLIVPVMEARILASLWNN